jgi:hypothetical protein
MSEQPERLPLSEHSDSPRVLSPETYCRRCDLFRPCLCDEERDPAADASKSNSGVVKPKEDR